jgi:hypothetical protein
MTSALLRLPQALHCHGRIGDDAERAGTLANHFVWAVEKIEGEAFFAEDE